MNNGSRNNQDTSLWPSHRVSNTYLDSPASEPHNPTPNGHRRPGSHHGHHGHHGVPSRSILSTLAADENVIYQRKQNVRRFGAGWIRPPGVAKTYQAIMDEAAEREEQEILARREQVLLDLAAAQTDAQNRQEAAEGQDEETMEGERDLDDEVPEAEADVSDVSASDDESAAEDGDTSAIGTQGDVTFNEDSLIEGSMVASEVQHMLEMEEAEMAGVLQDERDLDDDVPEAGSYEHTDTDLDSSDEEESSRISMPSAQRRRSGHRRSSGVRTSRGPRNSVNLETNRSSFGLDGSSSILDGSSFLRSSPAAARGSLRSRFMGARSQRGGA